MVALRAVVARRLLRAVVARRLLRHSGTKENIAMA